MIVVIKHCYQEDNEEIEQVMTYDNVIFTRTEYQRNNGDNGSYWLFLHFGYGSEEYKKYKGRLGVQIDLMEDRIEVFR